MRHRLDEDNTVITWCQKCEENPVQGKRGENYELLCLTCAYPHSNWVYDAICFGVRMYKTK